MKLSISTRLALSYGLSLLLILCGFVVYLYWSFHIGLHQEFRAQLQQDKARLQQAISLSESTPSIHIERVRSQLPSGIAADGGVYVRLLALDGRTIYQSPNLEDLRFFTPRIPPETIETTVNASWQGRPVQSLYAPLSGPQEATIGWLEVTRFESGMHGELHRLGWLLTIGILVGAVCALGLGRWMAQRALQPIAAITSAAKEIQAENPQKRLPADFGIRDELTDLAETLNDLLGRLDASLDRERRFRADAAHQMFTPLTAIQSEIEVALRRPRSESDYRQSMKQVHRQSEHLAGIVEGLLQLSRAEAIEHRNAEYIDIGELILNRLDEFTAYAEQKSITMQHRVSKHLFVPIHREHFYAVFDSLLENALKYTPDGGSVMVSARRQQGRIELEVKDSGPGLSAEERGLIFDRFYRSERPEISQARGIGLGLSIVRAIVSAYGGTVSAQSDGGGSGSVFTVCFTRDEIRAVQ